jgi:UDP-glucose 4-epimerase
MALAYSEFMTWIVTGANGYLGRRVIGELQKNGQDYIGFDLTPSIDENIHQCDIADLQSFFERKKIPTDSITGIIHLAALKNAAESNKEPKRYWASNFDNTVNLFDFAILKGFKKFVFASSAAIYAPKVDSDILENDICIPNSVYGITKLAAENYINGSQFKDKIQVTSLRIFNMIGAQIEDFEYEDWSNFPFRIIGTISKKKELTVYHAKGQPSRFGIRDYVDVRDVAKAIWLAAQSKNGLGVMNICTGKGISSLDLIVEFEKQLNKKISYKISEPLFDEVPVCIGDFSKANDLLNWSPAYSFAATISQIIKDCSLN